MSSSPPKEETQTLKHSKWGLLSVLMSFAIITLGYLAMNDAFPSFLEKGVFLPIRYGLYCVLFIGTLFGAGFAIIGLQDKNRKRFFSVLGLIIHGIVAIPTLLISTFLLIIALPFICLISSVYLGHFLKLW